MKITAIIETNLLIRKYILIFLMLCAGSGGLLYGQAYPIWVTAMPSTLSSATVYLGDFGHIEATGGKINFLIELRDPVEQFRQVHFRLTVLRNGTPVMMTDPSIAPPLITLQKGFPIMVNGSDLSFYFELNHLVGITGYNLDNVLPEDYYSICVEVIDFARQKVISDKVCVSGFLNQLDPPLLYFPRQDFELSLGQSANLMFNWQLTGISVLYYSNISYIFELRELNPDFENVQEYFENNTLIYQTEVQNNSLIYGVGLPPLVKDKKYVWRVRALARDDNGQELVGYFHNNGISEIWSFNLPQDPGRNKDFCHALDPKQAKNQTPAYQVYIDDVVHVGHFDLVITDLQNASGDAAKGSGNILIPFLDIEVEVSFDNLKINDKHEAFAGTVSVNREDNWLARVRSGLNGSLNFVEAGIISETDIQNILIRSNNINQNAPNQLPFSLNQILLKDHNVKIPYDLIVNEMHFTPQGASFNAVMLVPNGNEGYAKFGISGVGMDDSGFEISDLKLFLSEHTSMPGFDDDKVHIVANPGELNPDKGSFAEFNCEGFKEFNLQGNYQFDKEVLVRASNISVPASAKLHINTTTWDNVIAEVLMQDFAIPGMDEWRFEVLNGWVDFSAARNLPNIQLPDNYVIPDIRWKGFYLTDLKVILPQELKFGHNNALEMLTKNMIIDENGISFSGKGFNLLSLGDGSAGGWALSFKELQLNIAKNEFEYAAIKGQIVAVPIVDTIDYNGRIYREENAAGYALDLFPQENIDIPFLKAKIEPTAESVIAIRQAPPFCGVEWKPYANINGPLTVRMPETAFSQFGGNSISAKMSQIKDSLKTDGEFEFDLTGVVVKGFKINHPKLPKGRFFGIDRVSLSTGGVSLADVALSVEGVDLLEEEFELDGRQPGLGLGFHVSNSTFGVHPKFWALNANAGEAGPYALSKIEIEVPKVPKKAFSCSCGSENQSSSEPDYCQAPLPYRDQVAIRVGSTLQVGHFNMEVTSLSGNNGTGKMAIPFLGGELEVEFTNLEIDEHGMMTQGTVQSTVGNSFSDIKEEALQQGKGVFKMQSVLDKAAFIQRIKKQTKDIKETFVCPVSITKEVSLLSPVEQEGSFEFVLMGVNFESEVARVNCMAFFTTPEGPILKFGLAGLDMRPNGFNLTDLKLFLTEESTISAYDGKPVKLLISQPGDPESGSYIGFDCDGFNAFHLKGIYTFTPGVIVNASTGANPVEAYLDINTTAWDDFEATVKMSPFAIPGLDGWSFEVIEAFADFSISKNLSGMQFPEKYFSANPAWQGFFVSRFRVTMPDQLKFGGKQQIIFDSENLLIDHYGVSGTFYGNNLLSLKSGKKDDWAMSLEQIYVKLDQNKFVDAQLEGVLSYPSRPFGMTYAARLYKEPLTKQEPNGFYAIDFAPTNLLLSNNQKVKMTSPKGYMISLRQRPKVDAKGSVVMYDGAIAYAFKPFAYDGTPALMELNYGVLSAILKKYRMGGTSILLEGLGLSKWRPKADNELKEFQWYFPDQQILIRQLFK